MKYMYLFLNISIHIKISLIIKIDFSMRVLRKENYKHTSTKYYVRQLLD